MTITKSAKIYVAGHNGLVGSAIVRELKKDGYKNIITANKKKLNLLDSKKTLRFLKKISLNSFLLQQQKWVVYTLIANIKQIIFIKI